MKYEYTYKITQLQPLNGHMLIEFTPVDTTLTKLSRNIPMLSTYTDSNGDVVEGLTAANIDTYVDKWAPHNTWYAQKLILDHSDVFLAS